MQTIGESLTNAGVKLLGKFEGAHANCPREDLFRIAEQIKESAPDVVISFGRGSTIDAGKAAKVLRTLGGEIDSYFGTGLVTETLKTSGRKLHPHVAIQTAASSAAHLTKYSNITDLKTGQKKLIIDEAIVPSHPVFDHRVTYTAPRDLTTDGALDGIAHVLEVFYGAVGKPLYAKIKDVALTSISLVVNNLPLVLEDQTNTTARDAFCLATDLGGYAIMLGGTNGEHLTSFSLVDILSRGRACAMMNPYYTVFFAPGGSAPSPTCHRGTDASRRRHLQGSRLHSRRFGLLERSWAGNFSRRRYVRPVPKDWFSHSTVRGGGFQRRSY